MIVDNMLKSVMSHINEKMRSKIVFAQNVQQLIVKVLYTVYIT
jgi:hypothetical protein